MREIMGKLAAEVKTLEHELRIELPKEIKVALAHGDLKENAEYHAALERQSFVQARIMQLRTRLTELSSLDLSNLPVDRAGLGSRLTVLDLDTDVEIQYELVLPEIADISKGLLSIQSPIGQGLMGKQVDDETTVTIPKGTKHFEILALKTIHQLSAERDAE